MSANSVAIVDSGGANLASLINAFSRLNADATVTDSVAGMRRASHIVIPGVGAAAPAMAKLRESRLIDTILSASQPVLGICLGLQLLSQASDEGQTECLGVFASHSQKLKAVQDYPVPNMGWCATKFVGDNPLFRGIESNNYFYFVHSYALPQFASTIATANHGFEFSAAAADKNFYGVQFHPEKSSVLGAQVLQNFLDID